MSVASPRPERVEHMKKCCEEVSEFLLLDLKMIILTVKILFQKDSTEGFSEEA